MHYLTRLLLKNRVAALTVVLATTAASVAPLVTAQSDQGIPVRVEQVHEQLIQRVVHLTGTVTSARTAELSAATAGLVVALYVDAGSEVAAGDALLALDPVLAQWQWESSKAAADTARVALADARRRLDEGRSLAPQFTISESAVRDLEAEVAQDESELQRAEAEAGYRKGLLDRHQLHAPFAGVISLKRTELGEWVNPGQPVLTLVATQELRIDFPVAEDYLDDITLDTPVSFTLGDNLQNRHAGKVATVVPVTDPGARTFLLRVQAADSNPSMMPGMSARAQLTLESGRRGLTVPRDAILKFPDGRVVVWVVKPGADGPLVAETRVTTGIQFDGYVEILDGLAATDRVVIQGNEALQNGQHVTVLPPGQD